MRALSFSVIVAALLYCAPALAPAQEPEIGRMGTVTETFWVHESASYNSPKVFELSAGQVIETVERKDKWTLARTQDGRTGWIAHRIIRLAPNETPAPSPRPAMANPARLPAAAQAVKDEAGVPAPPVERVADFIAVLDILTGPGVDTEISAGLTDLVINETVRLKQYRVIDRANRDKILAEQGFQQQDCTDESCRVQAGQMLGVGRLITGKVTRVVTTHMVTLQIINVETGEIVNSATQTCESDRDLIATTRTAVLTLFGRPVPPVEALAADLAAEKRAKEEAEGKRLEAERKAKEESERRRLEAERMARGKAERQRLEAAKKAREEAERGRLEAERATQAEAEKKHQAAERPAAEETARGGIEKGGGAPDPNGFFIGAVFANNVLNAGRSTNLGADLGYCFVGGHLSLMLRALFPGTSILAGARLGFLGERGFDVYVPVLVGVGLTEAEVGGQRFTARPVLQAGLGMRVGLGEYAGLWGEASIGASLGSEPESAVAVPLMAGLDVRF